MRRALSCFFAVVLSICFVGCDKNDSIQTANIKYLTKNTTDSANVSNEYRIIEESENLVLQFNDATTDVCVVDKVNNFTWATDAKSESDETLYNILYLSYHTDSGNVGVLSSSNHCISKGQYKAEKISCQRGRKILRADFVENCV